MSGSFGVLKADAADAAAAPLIGASDPPADRRRSSPAVAGIDKDSLRRERLRPLVEERSRSSSTLSIAGEAISPLCPRPRAPSRR